MNVNGIGLLRALRLPAPRVESISADLTDVDLDRLFGGADRGVTIVAMDSTEPIDQIPLFEKDVRRYRIKRDEYFDVRDQLILQLEGRGVAIEDMRFLTHQTYTPDDISFSGRVMAVKDKYGFGRVVVESVESLRKGHADFDPQFIYRCPIVSDQVRRSENQVMRDRFDLPPPTLLLNL